MKNLNVNKKTAVVEFLETSKDFLQYNIERDFKALFGISKKSFKKSTDGSGRRIIKGYASTSHKDRHNDVISREALQNSKDDLLQKGSNTVFFNHDKNKPIGKVLETTLDNFGLMVEVMISKASDVNDIWTKIKEGILKSMSIGGRFKKVQVERDEEGDVVGFKVLEMELMEVSVVGIPANPNADIFSVAEKSFSKALNTGKESNMKKVKDVKKEKKTEEAKEASPVFSKEQISFLKKRIAKEVGKTMLPVADGIKSLQSELGKLVKKNEKVKEEKVEKEEKTEKISKEDLQIKLLKKMNKRLTSLEAVAPSRKGSSKVDEEEEVEEKEEKDEVPEKALKSIDDEKTVAFLKYVMNDAPEQYKKLLKGEERVKANGLWLALMATATKCDRN